MVVEKPLHVQAKWRNPTVLVAQTVRVPSEQVEETTSNSEVDADIAAMIAVSAALSVSGIPFNGPIGAARVGYVNGRRSSSPRRSEPTQVSGAP